MKALSPTIAVFTITDSNQLPAPANKKRTLLQVTVKKAKIFFWNLHPLHWYDDFKVIKINMDEFMCKKTILKNKD